MTSSHLAKLFFALCLITIAFQSQSYSTDYDKYISFHWKGALSSHSITLKVFPLLESLENDSYNSFLVLYTKSQTSEIQNYQIISLLFEEDAYPVLGVQLQSLVPLTTYYYCFIFETESTLDGSTFNKIFSEKSYQEFSFQTTGVALTPYNFTFGAASCADTGSASSVFNLLKEENLGFFIHMGDLHYKNIDTNETERFYNAYYQVFSSSTQKPFFQDTPIFYVWDDHDFGPNNANGNSPAKAAAHTAYKKFVPSSPLKNYLPSDDSSYGLQGAPVSNSNSDLYLPSQIGDENGIFRSFIIGRCLFIILDLRSFLEVQKGDILGQEQMTWLENQLRFAGYNKEIVQVFLISSFPWIHVSKETEWSLYETIQQQIAKWIEKYIYKNSKELIMVSGDAHMIALDDGSNNIFGGFPVVQAASLDRVGSCKGGPYSHGVSSGRDHYAVIQVTDYANETICVKINLKEKNESIIAYDTCFPDLYPQKPTSCPVGYDFEVLIWTILVGAIVVLAFLYFYKIWYQDNQRSPGYIEMSNTEGRYRMNED